MENKEYSIFILGYPVEKPEQISSCFSMLTYGLTKGFEKIPNVKIVTADVIENYNPLTKYFSATLPTYLVKKIPNVDFIIAINYCAFFNTEGQVDYLRTKCKKVVSFLECPAKADFCFVLKHTYDKIPIENQYLLSPIYLPEFTHNVPKEPKSILLDHLCLVWMNDKNKEWSRNIWEWLEEIKDEYKLYCLVDADTAYANKGNPHEVQMKYLPKYITPIFATNYVDYMKKTETMETFIVTHMGSYNFSVVDMISRGIRVFAPYKFVPKINEHLFSLSNFKNKEELLTIIKKPIDNDYNNNNIKKCISIDTVAQQMNEVFQKWI